MLCIAPSVALPETVLPDLDPPDIDALAGQLYQLRLALIELAAAKRSQQPYRRDPAELLRTLGAVGDCCIALAGEPLAVSLPVLDPYSLNGVSHHVGTDTSRQ